MPRCKLMIVGEAGVGKTSLLSLLTGEDFNPKHKETEGVDTDFVNTFTIRTDTWEKRAFKYYRLDEEYKEISARKLAKILPDSKPPVVKPIKQPVSHSSLKKQFDTLMMKLTQQPSQVLEPAKLKLSSRQKFVNIQPIMSTPFQSATLPVLQPTTLPMLQPRPTHQRVTIPQLVSTPPPTTKKDNVHPTHNLNPAVNYPEERPPETFPSEEPSQNAPSDLDSNQTAIYKLAMKLKKQNLADDIQYPLKFSSFDFAGQDHYKPMHHCFISSRAVYVVAFNVRHLLDEQQKNQCIEELKFWVNTIYVYTDAKVVLVGTHQGPYEPESLMVLTSDEKKYIKKIMTENFDKMAYAGQLQFFDDEIIATVENSIRGDDSKNGSGADVIREKLSNLGDHHPGNKDDFPVSYLQLELHIFKERQNARIGLVCREEVESWAKKYEIDDPLVPLRFFHDIGIIIDPSKLIYSCKICA